MSTPQTDYRMRLNVQAQRKFLGEVKYIITGVSPGPRPHTEIWHSNVFVNDTLMGTGSGHTKPLAMEAAALEALRKVPE
ncbi:hypothetical protein BDV98DRAFT_593912 [Pterulicium gracile]|uniref:DRBM domain-containing protein n=1 Tax=Pterulicium gracile TaxID=1884261 RepID=A0A5C3QQG5_9AGAR|nr:hypothetical protein BDV98DRAFT_593912 [Pterula gracilis]